MADEFKVHRLNAEGLNRAEDLATRFSECLSHIERLVPPGRERALVVTKLQEASFWAKRGIAINPGYQEGG